jgi:hypothetical protein
MLTCRLAGTRIFNPNRLQQVRPLRTFAEFRIWLVRIVISSQCISARKNINVPLLIAQRIYLIARSPTDNEFP